MPYFEHLNIITGSGIFVKSFYRPEPFFLEKMERLGTSSPSVREKSNVLQIFLAFSDGLLYNHYVKLQLYAG